MQLINNPQIGGLSGLAQAFQNGGLGEIVNSWIANGPNLPVSAEQLQSGNGQQPNQGHRQPTWRQSRPGGQAVGRFASGFGRHADAQWSVAPGGDLMGRGMDLLKASCSVELVSGFLS